MKMHENKNNMAILENEDERYLISYDTTICKFDCTTKKLYLNTFKWDYSQTTLKHLKHFINQYTDYEYINKQQFEKEALKNNDIRFSITL